MLADEKPPDVVVFGLGRYGLRLLRQLEAGGLPALGVDFDPEIVRDSIKAGHQVRFGDAQDVDFIDSLPLAGVPWVVSTLPDIDSNRLLLHAISVRGFDGQVAVVAREEAHGAALKDAGASTVLYPLRDAVDFAGEHLIQLMRERRGLS